MEVKIFHATGTYHLKGQGQVFTGQAPYPLTKSGPQYEGFLWEIRHPEADFTKAYKVIGVEKACLIYDDAHPYTGYVGFCVEAV